jgi:membrane-associated protease RseP (regulator of RpoE activity)
MINGMLATMNLIPVWHLDAGQLFHVIFSSLSPVLDVALAFLTTLMVFAVVLSIGFTAYANGGWWIVLIALIKNAHWAVFFIVLATGIWHKQGMDKEEHHLSRQAMTIPQVGLHLFVYATMTFVALWLYGGPLAFVIK